MGNKKISELATGSTPTGAELIEVVQGGANVKLTAQEIADLGSGAFGYSDLMNSRTVTTADAVVQGDNFAVIYLDSAIPFNLTINPLTTGSKVSLSNRGSAIVTFVDEGTVDSEGATTINPGQTALIDYRTSTEPIIYSGGGSGTVTDVTGTTNRITSTGGATPAIDIAASYVGQTSITTLGTIGTGTWNATAIATAKAGAPGGGSSGNVLTKNSGTDYDYSWSAPSAGFTNPMTTLGDTIYENATPAPARLAGNTTTLKMFLNQTGNGTVSSSPVWSTLSSGDIPALSYIPLTGTGTLTGALTVVGTSSNTFKLSFPSLGVTPVAGAGLLLENATAATSGNQQDSPSIYFRGQGWKTTATAASQSVDFRILNTPVQGTAAPTGTLRFGSSINGGAFFDFMTISELGFVNLSGSRVINFVGNGYIYNSGSNSQLGMGVSANSGQPSDGFIVFKNNNSGGLTASSGQTDFASSVTKIAPTSGTAPFNLFKVSGEVNQTGGANGQVVGYKVENTITAAANFVGVLVSPTTETNATTYNGILIKGSTQKSGFGTLTPSEAVEVVGNVRFSGALMPNNTAGTSGQVLTSAGAGSPPTWSSSFSGTNVTTTGVVSNVVSGTPSRSTYEFLWRDGTANSGNQDYNIFTGYTDATAQIEFTVVGVKTTDGLEGYSAKKIATFHKDGSADATLVGAVTTVHSQENAATNTPDITISMNGANVRVAYDLGGGIDVYRWTIWAKVTITQL